MSLLYSFNTFERKLKFLFIVTYVIMNFTKKYIFIIIEVIWFKISFTFVFYLSICLKFLCHLTSSYILINCILILRLYDILLTISIAIILSFIIIKFIILRRRQTILLWNFELLIIKLFFSLVKLMFYNI